MATFIQNQFSRPFHTAIDTRTKRQTRFIHRRNRRRNAKPPPPPPRGRGTRKAGFTSPRGIDFTDFTNSQNIPPLSSTFFFSLFPPPFFLLLFFLFFFFFFWPHVSQDRRKSRDVPTVPCVRALVPQKKVGSVLDNYRARRWLRRQKGRKRGRGRGRGRNEEYKPYWKYAEGEEERYKRGGGMTKRERMRLELGTLLLLVGPH